MSVFNGNVFSDTVFLVDGVVIPVPANDTHDGGGPARRKISSERPSKERKEREDILSEIKLAMGLLDESSPEVQKVEKVIERAKSFIPQAPNINLGPLINQLRALENALRKYEQDREEEEEILILTMLA